MDRRINIWVIHGLVRLKFLHGWDWTLVINLRVDSWV
jgi:hypothetical protein